MGWGLFACLFVFNGGKDIEEGEINILLMDL